MKNRMSVARGCCTKCDLPPSYQTVQAFDGENNLSSFLSANTGIQVAEPVNGLKSTTVLDLTYENFGAQSRHRSLLRLVPDGSSDSRIAFLRFEVEVENGLLSFKMSTVAGSSVGFDDIETLVSFSPLPARIEAVVTLDIETLTETAAEPVRRFDTLVSVELQTNHTSTYTFSRMVNIGLDQCHHFDPSFITGTLNGNAPGATLNGTVNASIGKAFGE